MKRKQRVWKWLMGKKEPEKEFRGGGAPFLVYHSSRLFYFKSPLTMNGIIKSGQFVFCINSQAVC